jgi:hypothetical protein
MFEKVSQEGFELTTTGTPITHANDINLLQRNNAIQNNTLRRKAKG